MDKFLRIIDANLNRCSEGMRVCEDIVRFVLDDRLLTEGYRNTRHRFGELIKELRGKKLSVKFRDVKGDIGKINDRDKVRKNICDIFMANSQRVKESLRSLEEITKLFNIRFSRRFKAIRFKIYGLEKKAYIKLEAL